MAGRLAAISLRPDPAPLVPGPWVVTPWVLGFHSLAHWVFTPMAHLGPGKSRCLRVFLFLDFHVHIQVPKSEEILEYHTK